MFASTKSVMELIEDEVKVIWTNRNDKKKEHADINGYWHLHSNIGLRRAVLCKWQDKMNIIRLLWNDKVGEMRAIRYHRKSS